MEFSTLIRRRAPAIITKRKNARGARTVCLRECRAPRSMIWHLGLTAVRSEEVPVKRKLLLLPILAAAMALAAPASADQFLLGFNGFDYHIASGTSTHYLDVGD